MKFRGFLYTSFLVAFLCVSSCTMIGSVGRRPVPTPTPPARPAHVVGSFEGEASWYGPNFHGKKTASGEIYDMYELTAAHKELPLGTTCIVTNLENDKSVTVRINDRGPFVKGRVIDLSYAAAKVIDMVDSGTARVRVEVLGDDYSVDVATLSPTPTPITTPTPSPVEYGVFYTIQVGSFTERANAEKLYNSLIGLYNDVRIEEFQTSETTYFRVRVGKFQSRDEASPIASELSESGLSGFITEM